LPHRGDAAGQKSATSAVGGGIRLALSQLLESGTEPGTLVHDLQNHDEITYQLVELDFRGDETFRVGGREVPGRQLRERILREMREVAAGPSAPQNLLYRAQKDGLATTLTGFLAAGLKVRDPYHATPEELERIRRAHLLLAHANAMQPGVFSLSSWDLVGALPLPRESVAGRMQDGDYRWVNRGGVDLLGDAPGVDRSAFGVPRAKALYGPLPEQLADPQSFVSRLKHMLAGRKAYKIHLGELVAVPDVSDASVCLLVIRLPGPPRVAVTALNFGRAPAAETLDLAAVPGLSAGNLKGRPALDAVSGERAGGVTDAGRLEIRLDALSGRTLILGP